MTNTSKINTHPINMQKKTWHRSKSGLKTFQKCEKCPPLMRMTFAVLAGKIVLLWTTIAQDSNENWNVSLRNFPQWIQCCQHHEWPLFIFNLLFFILQWKVTENPGSTTKTNIRWKKRKIHQQNSLNELVKWYKGLDRSLPKRERVNVT